MIRNGTKQFDHGNKTIPQILRGIGTVLSEAGHLLTHNQILWVAHPLIWGTTDRVHVVGVRNTTLLTINRSAHSITVSKDRKHLKNTERKIRENAVVFDEYVG